MTARASWPVGRLLLGGVVAAAIWSGVALARHPGFQPTYTLRTAAPVVALLIGAAFTHLVARLRQRVDVEGEFNPGGRALFFGVVMLVVTLLAWLLVSQALPATINALVGVERNEAGVVVQRIPLASDPACRFRLEVASAPAGSGAIARSMDECVSEALWNHVAAGDALRLQLISSALGAEIVGVLP
jgi:hypothetical protein